jgi:8-oxo-dGTP pyrophosphatase MutT (NUDIX family)
MGKSSQQYAALPWRHSGAGIEVLLISSRETKRWVLPKGWPIEGLTPAETALREAYEEAGIGGQIDNKPIGTYIYGKRLTNGRERLVTVDVFPLEVMVQHPSWPEQEERTLLWTLRNEAAELVHEPELASLIKRLK